MVKILSAPDTVLSQVAKEYSFSQNNLAKLLKDMEVALESATDPKGVGLAAPQIGKSVAVFIAKPSEKGKLQVFVNPKVLEKSETPKPKKSKKKDEKRLEGCLSLPNIWGEVERPEKIKVAYQDEKGKQHTKEFKGFMAIIVQHEIDHLNGILFPKYVLEQRGHLYKSHKNEKGHDEFDEIKI